MPAPEAAMAALLFATRLLNERLPIKKRLRI
jgi:hypothetical protein